MKNVEEETPKNIIGATTKRKKKRGKMKPEIRKIREQLDKEGTELMLRVLRFMDSENLYYTSFISKKLKYTYANTSIAIKRLIKLGLLEKCKYFERGMYGSGKRYFKNITGLALTNKGNFIRKAIPPEFYELKLGRIKKVEGWK